jgi:hypothetical protein
MSTPAVGKVYSPGVYRLQGTPPSAFRQALAHQQAGILMPKAVT